jgi:hypothetical protein
LPSAETTLYDSVCRSFVMADPITILGAAAAASQLAAQAFTFVQFFYGLYGRLDTVPAKT